MAEGTIVLVHGTGVRLRSYEGSYRVAVAQAADCGLKQAFVPCAWGDPLGVEFEGKSMPDPPTPEQLKRQEEELAHWSWLLDDPLFELNTLTVRDNSAAAQIIPRPGEPPQWQRLWDSISAYRPSPELELLLQRGGLAELWPCCWTEIVAGSPIPRQAFEASAHELADVSRALARSVVAQLHVLAEAAGLPGPNSRLRIKLVDRMMTDWNQQVFGLGNFFFNLVKRAGTRFVRKRRNSFNEVAALPIGDVLLYQTNGKVIRDFIGNTVARATPPVTLAAHSLGGIACVDLLALPDPPHVNCLVTFGSQSPLLYEIGALPSLRLGSRLPVDFPPWLNVFDRNDFLSFVAKPLFPAAVDFEVTSGQPFPDSHSAYFGNEAMWTAIGAFITNPTR